MRCFCCFGASRRGILSGLAAGAAAIACEGLGLRPAMAQSVEPRQGELVPAIEALVARAGLGAAVAVRPFRILPETMPWTTVLGTVRKGQAVTFLLAGRWFLAREADLWFEPGIVFHARVSMDRPYNPMHNSGTFIADADGPLAIARSAGEFHSSAGNLATPADLYRKADGWIEGVALVWENDPATGLARLNAAGDHTGLIAGERARLADPPNLPANWQPYFQLQNGPGIFRTRTAGVIECLTERNVCILQYPTFHPLEPGTRLSWKWQVDELPSRVSEASVATHDYLSVAVEFDDGQDFTYMWSRDLPVGQTFRCPLPGWDKRETHHVVRSGTAELGRWQIESADVFDHYRAHIGGSARSIVGVWLIAVSCFARGRGRAQFSDVALSGADWRKQVL